MKSIKNILLSALITSLIFCSCNKDTTNEPTVYVMEYAGSPFIDSVSTPSVQSIPGRVQCEFYDFGGDSIAYSDKDRNNNGSGSLNPGLDYLSQFRVNEAPDISFTKFHDQIDNSPYSIVQPEENQLYLGWTEPGEWTRYSVDVEESGIYQIGTMYTSNRGGSIQLFIDDTDSTGFLDIPTTYDAADPIDWRNWHHWNYVDSLTKIQIDKGRRIITLRIEEKGNFNFDYIEFSKVD